MASQRAKQAHLTEEEANKRIESILQSYDLNDPVRVSILSAFKVGMMVEHPQLKIQMGEASKKTGIDIATISRVLPSVIAGVGVYLAQAHFHVSHISDIVRGFMIL
jgi:uncharacterized protein YerC